MKKSAPDKDSTSKYWIYPDAIKALDIAVYYGFTPIAPLSPDKSDHDLAKGFVTPEVQSPHIHPAEEIALLRTSFAKSQPQLPLQLARERKDGKRHEYCLDVIGTTRSIADASVIKTAYEIVRSEGYQNVEVELNTIGDRESFARYNRELATYFRKHISDLHPECRQLMKKSPLAIITCTHEKCVTVKEHAPRPMNYLSEPSRTHFKEVLELLEMTSLPYTINQNLIDACEFASHTIFKVYAIDNNKQVILARGARWANLAKKIGLKKDVPSVSAVISLKRPQEMKQTKIKKPMFYFIQMGQEAKLKSLLVIEILRQARIPVYHALTKDKLTAQLSNAESLMVPFVLIMGQKESIENTVLVREMNNRSQETVKIEHVADYLRKLME